MTGKLGWVEDHRGGMRRCVWFPVSDSDLDEARAILGVDEVESADYAMRIHRHVKWCDKYNGFGCDEEGEWHDHYEFYDGEPTHTAVWDANDRCLYPVGEVTS